MKHLVFNLLVVLLFLLYPSLFYAKISYTFQSGSSVSQGENLEGVLTLNTTESADLLVWHYLQKGRTLVSPRGKYATLQKISVNASASPVHLSLHHSTSLILPGNYTWKVYVNKNGLKTNRTFSSTVEILPTDPFFFLDERVAISDLIHIESITFDEGTGKMVVNYTGSTPLDAEAVLGFSRRELTLTPGTQTFVFPVPENETLFLGKILLAGRVVSSLQVQRETPASHQPPFQNTTETQPQNRNTHDDPQPDYTTLCKALLNPYTSLLVYRSRPTITQLLFLFLFSSLLFNILAIWKLF